MAVNAPAAIARIEGLTYWYPGAPEPALRDVDSALEEGLTLVVGPSGSGKSSFLRLFNGLVPHFHGGRIGGAIEVCGHDVLRTPTRVLARSVGFVFQDPEKQRVYGTVEREVAFGLENLGVDRHEMHARVDETLDRLGIAGCAGGRSRPCRAASASASRSPGALALRPRILVLDEPTSQLDREGAASVQDDGPRPGPRRLFRAHGRAPPGPPPAGGRATSSRSTVDASVRPNRRPTAAATMADPPIDRPVRPRPRLDTGPAERAATSTAAACRRRGSCTAGRGARTTAGADEAWSIARRRARAGTGAPSSVPSSWSAGAAR